jgi:hypothetical protein
VVLTHLAVAIADGADCLCDIDALRNQSGLFGEVASVTTAWRAVKATTAPELRAIRKAVAKARETVWAAAPPGDITIDFDATLLDVHSEKQDAAPTYKRGYGFHPLGAWCDTTGEPLALMLRPGNAGSNDADDHLELLDQAIGSLPVEYQAGHEPGDKPGLVRHHILLRGDPWLCLWPYRGEHRVLDRPSGRCRRQGSLVVVSRGGLGRSARGGRDRP